MNRIAAVILVAFAVMGGGCAQLKNIETAIQLGTASVANPVTKTRLNQMESATTLVFAGLNTWRDTCEQGLINANCKDQIRTAQVYTKQIPPYMADLRRFVKTNDQVNATVVWNQIIDVIGTVKAQAAAGGVTINTNVGA